MTLPNQKESVTTTLHRMLHKQKRSYDGDTIMLYIGFSEVNYADFYAKILD